MASDNNAELLRAFVVPGGGTPGVGERAVSRTVASQVFADVEAGGTLFRLTPSFILIAVVTDLNTGAIITNTVSGTLGSGLFSTQAATIPVASLAAATLIADHVFEVTVALQVGGGPSPIADFAQTLFLVTS